MNHTVTYSANPNDVTPITHPGVQSSAQNQESLLDRLISRLSKITKGFSVENQSIHQHKSFMDENLLDSGIGPEISRTLRR